MDHDATPPLADGGDVDTTASEKGSSDGPILAEVVPPQPTTSDERRKDRQAKRRRYAELRAKAAVRWVFTDRPEDPLGITDDWSAEDEALYIHWFTHKPARPDKCHTCKVAKTRDVKHK